MNLDAPSLTRAIETGDVAALPGRRDEDWRWTDLRGLLRALPPRSEPSDESFTGPFDKLKGATVDLINGGSETIALEAGAEETWRVVFGANVDAGSHLNTLDVQVGEGARLLLLETYLGDDVEYVADTRLRFRLADGASVERVVLAEDGPSAVSVSRAEVELVARSRFAQTVVTSGARRQRIETQVRHPGAEAMVRLDGIYLVRDRRHADLTTVVTHAGAGGGTDQRTRGVVDDQGRGVFQGRIVVEDGADQTDARMKHDALILSDRAEIDAKPELLIFADDVSCSHGNTVGALSEEALFYAAQRGIPPAEARALLTEAFVGEVVDRIEHLGAREVARAWVSDRLKARAP